jgi:hypothetical protein
MVEVWNALYLKYLKSEKDHEFTPLKEINTGLMKERI